MELQLNARTVARPDSRKRVWGSPDYPSDRLLYPCEGGAVDLLREHIGEVPWPCTKCVSDAKVVSLVEERTGEPMGASLVSCHRLVGQ